MLKPVSNKREIIESIVEWNEPRRIKRISSELKTSPYPILIKFFKICRSQELIKLFFREFPIFS